MVIKNNLKGGEKMEQVILLDLNKLDFDWSYKDGIQKVGFSPWALIKGELGYILINREN